MQSRTTSKIDFLGVLQQIVCVSTPFCAMSSRLLLKIYSSYSFQGYIYIYMYYPIIHPPFSIGPVGIRFQDFAIGNKFTQ